MARGCILTVLLMLAGSGMCQAVAQTIPDGYVQVARAHGIPAEVLYAVSLTETAMAPGPAVISVAAPPPPGYWPG